MNLLIGPNAPPYMKNVEYVTQCTTLCFLRA